MPTRNPSPITHDAHSEADTIRVATEFAKTLKPGDIVTLHGDLGAGKSVVCRAVIRALAGDPALDVPSPTFPLLQTYDTPRGEVWHFDLYRLKEPEEIYELGWEEALSGGIVLIEWPEKLGGLLPARRIHVSIEESGGEGRIIAISPPL